MFFRQIIDVGSKSGNRQLDERIAHNIMTIRYCIEQIKSVSAQDKCLGPDAVIFASVSLSLIRQQIEDIFVLD